MRKLNKWIRFVITPNVYPKRWQDRLFQGHWSLGPLVIFGANAMHWAVNLRVGKQWWCFHPTTNTFGECWPWYFYISPDATPNEAIYRTGRRFASNRCYDQSL